MNFLSEVTLEIPVENSGSVGESESKLPSLRLVCRNDRMNWNENERLESRIIYTNMKGILIIISNMEWGSVNKKWSP